MYLDSDHQRDIESIKIKIETSYHDEVEALKRNHALSIENLQT